MPQEDQARASSASERGRQDPSGRPRGDRLPVPHEGSCGGIPPLRREPYAGLRRVSHEQCPERSRRRGRRVLARRLRARADRRGARDHRPGRSQDGHQRTELWPEDRHGKLRGQQDADVRQPDQRAAFSAQCAPEAVQAVLAGLRGVEDAAGTVSDLISARIWPAAVEMMDTLTLQAAEPPSGAVIRPALSRSWSSSFTARGSWPRRWRAWASRCPSRTLRKCSTHRSGPCWRGLPGLLHRHLDPELRRDRCRYCDLFKRPYRAVGVHGEDIPGDDRVARLLVVAFEVEALA